jgi:hypothetical protein
MVRVDPAVRPGRRHEQGQFAARREQDGGEPNRLAGMSGTSVRRAVPAPDNGTKRAQIGKASGYTHRSFRPDAVRLPASCGDCKWFGDGHKRDSAESAGI